MPRYCVSVSKFRLPPVVFAPIGIGCIILVRSDRACAPSGSAYIFSFAHITNLIKTVMDFQAVQKRNLADSIGSAIECCTQTCHGKGDATSRILPTEMMTLSLSFADNSSVSCNFIVCDMQ